VNASAAPSLVVLTGAGISAESGLPTFRGADGLWEGHRVEEVASPAGFARNPELVHRFYNLRRAALARVEPNPAHHALARLEREWPGTFLLVTQNVDDLHERAGSRRMIHLHGELRRARCARADCGWSGVHEGDLGREHRCPACGRAGDLRPDIVWFGEVPMRMEECLDALQEARWFAAIGTSGLVYPAAGFVDVVARRTGARTVEINLEATGNPAFREVIAGPASRVVPTWVEECLRALTTSG
jgi:NAD-dependent deacetylase